MTLEQIEAVQAEFAAAARRALAAGFEWLELHGAHGYLIHGFLSPLTVRISGTDWEEGGWDVPQSVELARRLKAEGMDLIDCSSGGALPDTKIPIGSSYQLPIADQIRREAEMATAAVGMITDPE